MLVFFPSYQAMDEAVQFWKQTVSEKFGFFRQLITQPHETYQPIWSLLERYKHVVLEPREKSAFTKVRFPRPLFSLGSHVSLMGFLGNRGVL